MSWSRINCQLKFSPKRSQFHAAIDADWHPCIHLQISKQSENLIEIKNNICDSATVGILLTDEDAKCKIWTSLDKKHNSQQTNGIAILSAFNVKSESEKKLMNLSKAKQNNHSD